MTLWERDFNDIFDSVIKINFDINNRSYDDLVRWLHFKSNIYMMSYYHCYPYSCDSSGKDRISKRIRYLYDETKEKYSEYLNETDINNFKIVYNMPSYHEIKRLINDIINAGYPHQTIIFCYRTLIEGWTIRRIVDDLSDSTLEKIFTSFVNEYSSQSQLPAFLVNMYFIRMKEKLSNKLKTNTSKKDWATAEKLSEYMNWVTGNTLLSLYYGKNREHDIADWCNKVKNKVLNNALKNMNSVSPVKTEM
ncbi:hypothetical protein [Pseudobacteroides cellulosolvens]|uniref:Uncharacterized protein n=1 Tax=Pseudobacteroides cellulosolvens ATCC 35603 = DSM 2933 TaxID=398512 RepID=A0A0L6JPX8_9FIRM|nr:hypothetical protein [Pseudobacteroides cellulosolvens]KNY27896.1 hypothetical protein Bccel_3167 [Pseudobacteroides cellulosolvens ATCC 35603 = DSM 2933]